MRGDPSLSCLGTPSSGLKFTVPVCIHVGYKCRKNPTPWAQSPILAMMPLGLDHRVKHFQFKTSALDKEYK